MAVASWGSDGWAGDGRWGYETERSKGKNEKKGKEDFGEHQRRKEKRKIKTALFIEVASDLAVM